MNYSSRSGDIAWCATPWLPYMPCCSADLVPNNLPGGSSLGCGCLLGCRVAEHLLLQLGIHLVCDDNDVRQQLFKSHMVGMFVQRRKKADLQDSGLIYDIGDRIALFKS